MRVAHCVGERIPRVFISELYSIKSHSPFGLSPMKQLINDRNNRCDPGTMGFEAERRQVSGERKSKSARAQTSLPNRPFSLVPFSHLQLVPVA